MELQYSRAKRDAQTKVGVAEAKVDDLDTQILELQRAREEQIKDVEVKRERLALAEHHHQEAKEKAARDEAEPADANSRCKT